MSRSSNGDGLPTAIVSKSTPCERCDRSVLVAAFGLKSLRPFCLARVKRLRSLVLVAAALLPPAALAQGTTSPKDAYLYIISPADGETVKGAFWCRFGLRNMGVTHADDNFVNSGHHHLLIDADEPSDPGGPIPQDRKHLHYGAGETEALIELPPGRHTLQLVLGDAKHFNFDPPVISKKITITVSSANASEDRGRANGHHRAGIRQHLRTSTRQQRSTAGVEPATTKRSWFVEFIRSHLTGMPNDRPPAVSSPRQRSDSGNTPGISSSSAADRLSSGTVNSRQ